MRTTQLSIGIYLKRWYTECGPATWIRMLSCRDPFESLMASYQKLQEEADSDGDQR